MSAPQIIGGTVRVNDLHYSGDEPILGVGRYADGSLILVAHRGPLSTLPGPGMIAYRTVSGVPDWHNIWSLPKALTDFILNGQPGDTGKVSNRRVEVLDSAAVPASINISRAINNWISY